MATLTATLPADAATITDGGQRVGHALDGHDTVYVTDSSQVPGMAVTGIELVLVTDTVVAVIKPAPTLSDPLGLTDTISLTQTVAGAYKLTISDDLGIGDSIGQVWGTTLTRSLSDTVTLEDQGSPEAVGVGFTVIDDATLRDSLVISLFTGITILDNVLLTDFGRAGDFVENVVDSMTLSDGSTPLKSQTNTAAELMLVSDEVVVNQFSSSLNAANLADATTLSDQVNQITARGRALEDSIAVTDSVIISRSITILDTAGALDTISTLKSSTGVADLTFGDRVSLTDSLLVSVVPIYVDPESLTDTVAVTRAPAVIDTANVTDTVVVRMGRGIAVSDAMNLTEQRSQQIAGSVSQTRSISDLQTLRDSMQIVYTRSKPVLDTVYLSDEIEVLHEEHAVVLDITVLVGATTLRSSAEVNETRAGTVVVGDNRIGTVLVSDTVHERSR